MYTQTDTHKDTDTSTHTLTHTNTLIYKHTLTHTNTLIYKHTLTQTGTDLRPLDPQRADSKGRTAYVTKSLKIPI